MPGKSRRFEKAERPDGATVERPAPDSIEAPDLEALESSGESVDRVLSSLMQAALNARNRLNAAQSELRDVELNARIAGEGERDVVVKKREMALNFYRAARAEASRARRKLLNTLRLISTRQHQAAA